MLLSFFQLSLAIRNVWPKRMGLRAFLALYMLLLLAGLPVTLFSCIPYGLFGILVAACVYGLVTCRDTAAQNVCMGMLGLVLAVITDNFLVISEKSFASKAIFPFSRIFPSTVVWMPSSISFPVSLISFVEASIKIHSKIGMVVLDGTAFRTILMPFKRAVF